MVDAEPRPDRNARWWVGCQPHIRALRETMHSTTANREVENLLQKCVSLYMAAIRQNSSLADEKIYIALTGGRMTAMEASFMWLGGWRPTSALLLVYSLMGVQLVDEIRNFGFGIRADLTSTSAVLSHRQLVNLTNVQKSTRGGEKKLSKKLAVIQMLLGDQDVLAAVMQVESSSSSSSSTSRSSSKRDLRTVLKPRMSRLKKLLVQADQLRLQTLHQLFLVLTPVQVARCAIAAFELAFMMRELGTSAFTRNLRTPIPAPSLPLSVALTDSLEISQPGPSCSAQDYGPSCSAQDYSTSAVELEPDD